MTYSQVMRLNQCYCKSVILQVQRNKVRELWKDGKLVDRKGAPFQHARHIIPHISHNPVTKLVHSSVRGWRPVNRW